MIVCKSYLFLVKLFYFWTYFCVLTVFFHCIRNVQFVAPDDSAICYSYRKFLRRVLEVAHCQNIGKLLKDIQNTKRLFYHLQFQNIKKRVGNMTINFWRSVTSCIGDIFVSSSCSLSFLPQDLMNKSSSLLANYLYLRGMLRIARGQNIEVNI